MFDQMFPAQRAISLDQAARRPGPPQQDLGVFGGFGSALADALPYAALSGAGAWTQVLDAYGKAAAFRDAPAAAMLKGQAVPDMDAAREQTIDQMGDSPDARRLRRRAKSYEPDPTAVGVAGQVVHGVAASLAKAGAYTLAGGPLAPALFGIDMGVTRAGELTDQGVDGGTAALAGAASGLAGAVGLRLPAALGATRLQSAAIGAVVNPALNVAEVSGIHALLEHADYPQIAARYDPFDPVSLAVASLTGAAFGAGFHGAKAHAPAGKADAPTLTPDEHAAALVMNEVRTRDADTLVNPHDLQAVNDAHDAQGLARAQLDAGEAVHVSHLVQPDPQAMEVTRTAVFERMTEDMRAELLADAGNRAEPGEIPAARARLAALQNDIDRIQAEGVFKAEAKAQQKQGLSRKQAEAAAHDVIGQRQADLQAHADRLSNIIETNRRAAQAEQDLAVLDRGQIPERFAHWVDDEALTGELTRSRVERSATVSTPAPDAAQPSNQANSTQVAEQTAGDLPASLVQRVVDAVQNLTGRAESAAPIEASPKADTPEQSRAFEIVTRDPDAMLPTGGTDAQGEPIYQRAGDLVREAHELEQQARVEEAAFRAAVSCALRFPQ